VKSLFFTSLCMFCLATSAFCSEKTPLKIEASVAAQPITVKESIIPGLSDTLVPVSIHIVNSSDLPQAIGTEYCGVHKLRGWDSDNQAIIVSGVACYSNITPPKPIVLNPGETYDQVCDLRFNITKIKEGELKFRLGIKFPLQVHLQDFEQPVSWSNLLEVKILQIQKTH
jgi:hypothetical protein